MKIDAQVSVAVDHIGVHIIGPRLDIMLHFGLLEAMKLKNGKTAVGRIVINVDDPPASLNTPSLPPVP